MNWLIKLLNNKVSKYYGFIDLEIGKVYLKHLTNGIVNNCLKKSCLAGNITNDALFFQLIDYELCHLSKKQIDNLSVQDGKKLRDSIRELLLKEGVIKLSSEDKDEFSSKDKEWFQKSKEQVQNNLNKLALETGEIPPGVVNNG